MSRAAAYLLPLILVGSLAQNLVSIDFAQPAPYDQCVDPVLPVLSLDAVENAFGERSLGGIKYPRLHFLVVGLAQRGWFAARYGAEGAAARLDPLMRQFHDEADLDKIARRRAFRPHAATIGELIVVGRVVSAVMGTLCVLFVFLLARALFAPAAGLMAAALVAAAYPFVYYAHTTNVDVPYLAWAAAALHAIVRAVQSGRARWLMLSAVYAALSVGTKDQAGGLFLLTAPALLLLLRWPGPLADEGEEAARTRRLPVGALAVSAVLAAAVLAFANGLPWDVRGVREHFGHILGAGHTDFREFEPGFRGQWLLLGETLLHLKDAMGRELLATSLLGAALLLALRPRRAVLVLVPAASYYVAFIGSIGYVYLRFTLPILMLLALCAAFPLDLLSRARRLRPVAAIAAVAFVASLAWPSWRMVRMMDDDPRTRAEAWLEREAAEASLAAWIEIPIHNIEFPLAATVRYIDQTTASPGFGDDPPEYFVFSAFDPTRKLLDPTPEPLSAPPRIRQFARDYDLVVRFAPIDEHPVRRGLSFQPTVLVYRLRAEEAAGHAEPDGGLDGEPGRANGEGGADGNGG